jgi:Ca2+-binding RTX toxin-like protein
LKGETGSDFLHGQTGNDKLFGDDGRGTLCGGLDDDYRNGGTGNDLHSDRIEEDDDIIANASTIAGTDKLAMLGISCEQVSIDLLGNDAVVTVCHFGSFNIRDTVFIESGVTATGAKRASVSFIDMTPSTAQIDDILN